MTGGDQDRLDLVATIAGEEGLEVWYSPFTTDLDQGEMLAFLADTADRAERIRRRGAQVVVVAGAEAALFVRGLMPGETFYDRLELLTPTNAELPAILAAVTDPLNAYLRAATATVRARFGGPVTYASLPFEQVDWSGFDYLGVDFYPNMVDGDFPGLDEALASLRRHGRPIVITEFGAAGHTGSSANAGHSYLNVDYDGRSVRPLRLSRELERNETEQATYLGALLDRFDAADGVDTVFVQTFANFFLVTRDDDPERDLDRASFGLVKVRQTADGVPVWEPKEAFAAVAARNARARLRSDA
ncbi:hypothetical protein O7606_18605 [Micromonospora sp. WMMD882]|uniref:hypothetical protein n=1 Tax=Micromonospora sp. WMMD882 TaxID=3015151 RepID=UPI00248C7F92|nr:hypothetical protein [Micromonospora sp. WMMD882]WBB78239.1 hypothetical protein O7606_18605 [Micromonospora sp. WMMD882]